MLCKFNVTITHQKIRMICSLDIGLNFYPLVLTTADDWWYYNMNFQTGMNNNLYVRQLIKNGG